MMVCQLTDRFPSALQEVSIDRDRMPNVERRGKEVGRTGSNLFQLLEGEELSLKVRCDPELANILPTFS